MSQWTHVSGCIRVDGLPMMTNERQVRSLLGTPSSNPFLETGTYEEGSNIPGGSEGTMQYAITKAGDGMVLFTVAVWGDLRDFGEDDTKEIEAWFARVAAVSPQSGMMIRSAHLLVEVEYGVSFFLIASDGNVQRIECTQPPPPTHE